jgi:hypothetical protein
VLEPVALGVDGVEPELERFGQVELEQPVVTEHLERDSLAGWREPYATVELVVGEPERGELLRHSGRRGGSDSHAACEHRRFHRSVLGLELVDLAQVVLRRRAEIREHRSTRTLPVLRRRPHAYATRSPVAYMTTIPAR